MLPILVVFAVMRRHIDGIIQRAARHPRDRAR
jgi:hypothetical protein